MEQFTDILIIAIFCCAWSTITFLVFFPIIGLWYLIPCFLGGGIAGYFVAKLRYEKNLH